MNILIVGKSGYGKSKLGDLIKTQIFKADPDATINVDDPDREVKTLGSGKNIYNVLVRIWSESIKEIPEEELVNQDIVVLINSPEFNKRRK